MKSYEELLAENEALVAQAALLVSLVKEAAEADESKDFLGHDWHDKYYDKFATAEHIAEIKAEAIEEFWFAGAGKMTTDEAKEYADKIRNTGTWLKDSNVNGGKRQGGEK